MKVTKKSASWMRISILLFIVVSIIYFLFRFTPLNTIFDVYEGLHLSYDNVGVEIGKANSPQDIQDNFNQIEAIERNKSVLVPSIAASIKNDSTQLLTQLLKLKQKLENTFPNSITILSNKQSSQYKANTECPSTVSDINDIYITITNIVYELQGIKDISDVTKNSQKVIDLCSGTDDGLQYYLNRLLNSMTTYIDTYNQTPTTNNIKIIITDFKNLFGLINSLLYQVNDLLNYNSGDVNIYINNIRNLVLNYAKNNKNNAPPGAYYSRRGKCFKEKKCNLNNK